LFLLVNTNARRVFNWVESILLNSPRRSVFLILVATAGIAIFIASVTLDQFPNSADEYVYIFQAEDLSRGKLWSDVHDVPEFFEFHHLLQKDGKWIGRFPPGYPLLLSTAYILHVPPFFVNVVLGVLLLLFLYRFAKDVYDERVAMWALITMAFAGFFLFNAGSFFSHVTSALFSLLFVMMVYRYFRNGNAFAALLAGLFLGVGVITRYYTAALLFLPFAILAVYRLKSKSIPMFFWMAVGGLLPMSFLLWYNFETTGNALMPVTQWGFDDEALGFVKGHTPSKGVKFTVKRLVMFLSWCSPQLLLLYLFYLVQKVRKIKDAVDHPEDYLFVILIVGYFFYYHSGGNQYGPRFYFEALPFLVVFVVVRVLKSGAKFPLALFISALAFQIVKIPFIANHEHEVIKERTDIYTQVREQHITNAVVLISSDASVIRPMPPEDLNRNDKKYQNDVLYARDLGEKNGDLKKYYPSRKFYRYVREMDKPRGALVPVAF
jgi:hypothetical protein